MDNNQEWDFLLFQPSTQHTAALCLQRSQPAPSLSDTRSDSSSLDSLDSRNGSLSQLAQDSCGQSEMSNDSQTCTEASSASITASTGDDMLDTVARKPSAEMQGSTLSGSLLSGDRSSLDSLEFAEVGSSGMPCLDSQMDVDDLVGQTERRQLASKLIAWRVVPLVSESLIKTEDMHVLGMTAP